MWHRGGGNMDLNGNHKNKCKPAHASTQGDFDETALSARNIIIRQLGHDMVS